MEKILIFGPAFQGFRSVKSIRRVTKLDNLIVGVAKCSSLPLDTRDKRSVTCIQLKQIFNVHAINGEYCNSINKRFNKRSINCLVKAKVKAYWYFSLIKTKNQVVESKAIDDVLSNFIGKDRRRWDSNPRMLAHHLISNQTQSTNSATSPYKVHTNLKIPSLSSCFQCHIYILPQYMVLYCSLQRNLLRVLIKISLAYKLIKAL